MGFFASAEEAHLRVWMVSTDSSSFFRPALCPACSSMGSSHGTSAWSYHKRHFQEMEGGEGSWGMYVPWLTLGLCSLPLSLSQRHSPAGRPSPPALATPLGSSSHPLQPRGGSKTPRVLHCPVGSSLNPAYTFTNTSVMGNLMLST